MSKLVLVPVQILLAAHFLQDLAEVRLRADSRHVELVARQVDLRTDRACMSPLAEGLSGADRFFRA